jgi:carbonic anhydrase
MKNMKFMRDVWFLVLFALPILILAPALLPASDQTAHWSYEGKEGPEHWSDLSDDYHMCRNGSNQSPVDLQQYVRAELPELVFEYNSPPNRETNNGHTIQLDVASGSFLKIPSRGRILELKQFHFHSPSEHTIEGQSLAMEMHFVHVEEGGGLAVVGVMLKEGKEHPVLNELWSFMPKNAGESVEPPIGIEETDLLPPTREYYYYSGSLTTPPCSEGVAWFVLKNPIEASAEQIAIFKQNMGRATNRPVQPRNSRLILD